MRLLTIACLSLFCLAFTVPRLTGPVVDNAGLINYSVQRELEALLRTAHQRGKIQLQILTVTSLEGESIEQASIQVTDQWKLGTAEADNGVLLMVAKDDRRVRIEVGQGLEGTIPDAYASRIIHDTILPLFRAGRFSEGIYAGALQILRLADPELMDQLGGQHAAAYSRQSGKGGSRYLSYIFILFIILMAVSRTFRSFIFGMLLAGGGRWRGYDSYGGGGFGRGGWGGGGWSGGGGGFSGGGASGSW